MSSSRNAARSEQTETAQSKSAARSRPVTHQSSKSAAQEEFSFSEGDPKGEFENTDGTLFEGQDLDSPTYLRRGVKIVL